jgi:hypothetical protein
LFEKEVLLVRSPPGCIELAHRVPIDLDQVDYVHVRGMQVKVTDGPVPFEVIETFEAMDGGTIVTVHIEGEPGGFFELAGGMVQKQLESQTAADFERLKKILEA